MCSEFDIFLNENQLEAFNHSARLHEYALFCNGLNKTIGTVDRINCETSFHRPPHTCFVVAIDFLTLFEIKNRYLLLAGTIAY